MVDARLAGIASERREHGAAERVDADLDRARVRGAERVAERVRERLGRDDLVVVAAGARGAERLGGGGAGAPGGSDARTQEGLEQHGEHAERLDAVGLAERERARQARRGRPAVRDGGRGRAADLAGSGRFGAALAHGRNSTSSGSPAAVGPRSTASVRPPVASAPASSTSK